MTEVAADQTTPIIQGPSDKEKKYDRQLRLWAANGQQALEDAHILLLNSGCGTVGVETLKNLVLPGIGNFTIMDDAVVSQADLGVNFFLDERSFGKPRAECCTELLQELNPDVHGHWTTLGEMTDGIFKPDATYTLVVYTLPMDPKITKAVESYCRDHKVPSIAIHSSGFYSYFRIDLPASFPIVDTHPDATATTDLRLLSPWPELSVFAQQQTQNMEDLNDHDHGHIPYVVLLLYYLEKWKLSHSENPPQTYSEKVAFRKMISDGARVGSDGVEENYEEAVAAVLKTITTPILSTSVREIFSYSPDSVEAESSFWIITNAVKQFYENHKALPLPGSVPDMKARSEVYVQMQNIYKEKARDDISEVLEIIRTQCGGDIVDVQEVEAYCKNAAFIRLIKGTAENPIDMKKLAEDEMNAEFIISPSLVPIYLAMKASEIKSLQTPEDIISEVSKVSKDAAVDDRMIQAALEVFRARGCELHNISALTGGMVAQEIIKIITKQYVPIDNTCIFDGISSRTQIIKT